MGAMRVLTALALALTATRGLERTPCLGLARRRGASAFASRRARASGSLSRGLPLLRMSGSDGSVESSAGSVDVAVQPAEPPRDLTGDGGVLKEVLVPGTAPPPRRSAKVKVQYVAQLAGTGEVVESRGADDPCVFTLGEGDVVTGWEVAVAAMRIGERARITCSPLYAYGAVGKAPAIPPDATIVYDLELSGLADQTPPSTSSLAPTPSATEASQSAEAATGALSSPAAMPQRSTMADLSRPDIARSPAEIAAAYEARLAKREGDPQVEQQGDGLLAAVIERLRTAYIFGLFDSQTGEKAPWYLNPLITFPSMFAFVGLGYWLVKVAGAVKLGVPGEAEVPLF